MIAVTGATGQLGSRVVRLLAERGASQRLVVRDPARAPDVNGADVAVASFEDEEAMRRALSGARTMFMVSGHEDPDRVELHRGMVRAAVAAGVQRVIYTSFVGAAPLSSFTYGRDHSHTERAIVDAGLELVALRDSLYADMAPLFVGEDGVLAAPASNGWLAWVARRDVARLAALVLLDDSHRNVCYDVTGPEAIDLYETTAILARVTGREIRYHAETIEEARAARAPLGEPWQVEGWIGSYLAIATGELAVTSHTIEFLTGERPWTFEEYLLAEPEGWAPLVA